MLWIDYAIQNLLLLAFFHSVDFVALFTIYTNQYQKNNFMLWIFCTIVASLSQVFRNLLQRKIDKNVDLLTASWSRFIFIFPLALIFVTYTLQAGYHTNKFILLSILAACLQITGNCLVVSLFRSGHFIVGMTFVKSEVVQTVLIAHFVFGEYFGISKTMSVILASIGLLSLLDFKYSGGFKAIFNKQNTKLIATGLAAGLTFAVCGFVIRGSIEELKLAFVNRSIFASSMQSVLWMILLQNVLFIIIKAFQGKLKYAVKEIYHYKSKFFVISMLSFFGSVFWFLAFAMTSVTNVKLVGQIEMVFSFLLSHFLLKEKLYTRQKLGIVLVFTAVILCVTGSL